MKFSMLVSALAVAFAVCCTGCKYDKSAKGAGDGSEGVSDIAGDEFADDAQTGSIDSMGQRSFRDYCTLCTDVSFDPVYFGFDSTVVPQGELGKIDAVAQHLKDNADRVTIIEGNCDDRGSAEYNLSLGENRATIIRNYLVQSGIAADRIQTQSNGEEKPAVTGSGESVWAQNRRGEFVIFRK